MKILSSKPIVEEFYASLDHKQIEKYHPHLAIITDDSNDSANKIYINQKLKAAKKCGIRTSIYTVNSGLDYCYTIQKLLINHDIHGIIVQQPCKYASFDLVRNTVPRAKDVDGFCADTLYTPCTPQGIITLLDYYKIEIANKHCVVLGRSEIVGRPLAKMLLNRNATVSVCHSKTPIEMRDSLLSNADIVFCCTGVANLLRPGMVRNDAVIIDVGITRDENDKLCGDAGHVEDWSATDVMITPVPGGIGPMTVLSLMKNTIAAAKRFEEVHICD